MKNEHWYQMLKCEQTDDCIFVEAVIDEQSPWFSGHFPGKPTLPGIAQLAIITHAIQKFNKDYKISEMKRVRFKQIIQPGDTLYIQAKKENQNFGFKILVNNVIACNGIIVGN